MKTAIVIFFMILSTLMSAQPKNNLEFDNLILKNENSEVFIIKDFELLHIEKNDTTKYEIVAKIQGKDRLFIEIINKNDINKSYSVYLRKQNDKIYSVIGELNSDKILFKVFKI